MLNLPKKLVKSDDPDTVTNLATGHFRSKMFKANHVFQLSEKVGQELVDLGIGQLSKVPTVSAQSNATFAKNGQQSQKSGIK